jgi:hypothetical protein
MKPLRRFAFLTSAGFAFVRSSSTLRLAAFSSKCMEFRPASTPTFSAAFGAGYFTGFDKAKPVASFASLWIRTGNISAVAARTVLLPPD